MLTDLQRLLRVWTTVWWVAGATIALGQAPSTPQGTIRFSREILPLLSDSCFACHGPDEKSRKGGLRLDTLTGARSSGKSGKVAVDAGHPDQSEILRRILSSDPNEAMPPPESGKSLKPEQVTLLRRWIEQGAPWGRHWAFEPPQRPTIPVVPGVSNPIDALVRNALAADGLQPAPEASRSTLIRRWSLDLTGLPPTPAEVDAFEADASPQAYERQVDRLLASPRFGERMAWEWMEAARYADSNGYQGDGERTMWPWRDWVTDAFNRNLPYDQFTLWQIAGDRLPGATDEQRLATGFLRNHAINGEGGRIAEENRIDYLFDQTETVATVWLGATFNCTRCHDHKFDPYTQKDYFGLLSFFNQTSVDGSGGNPRTPPVMPVLNRELRARVADAQQGLTHFIRDTEALEQQRFHPEAGQSLDQTPLAQDLSASHREHLKVPAKDRDAGRLQKMSDLWRDFDPEYVRVLERQRASRIHWDNVQNQIPKVMVMEDLPKTRPTHQLVRGSYENRGPEVQASLPGHLTPGHRVARPDRLELAQWLVSPTNPLPARVTVNRLWQQLFGVGLVKTSEDFGLQGERPSHPELLDWLALEFVESGWDVKALIRSVVLSATYRQTSQSSPETRERDPENRRLSRGPRFRMPSPMIRDMALASAGLLTERLGGSAVNPYQPPGVWEETTFGNKRYTQDHGEALYRRSLYVFWRRIIGPTLFFDVANRQTCTVKTPRTNVPLQALLTLNDIGYVEAARVLAQQVLVGDSRDPERLTQIFQRVLGRRPRPAESQILLEGLQRHRATYASQTELAAQWIRTGEHPAPSRLNPVELAAWTVTASTVLNLDEALTKE
jgi:hypothetical protein